MSFSRRLKEKASLVWEAGYKHPFVQELGQGVLQKEKFQFYLVQDYKYLLEYAKVFALGAVKAYDEKTMTNFTLGQYALLRYEMDMHRKYMQEFSIDLHDAQMTKSSLYNNAYTANMLSVAQKGGVAEIIATLLPCGWSYNDFATRLKEEYKASLAKNPYKSWLDMYTSQEFIDSFEWCFSALDELMENKSQEEKEYIEDIFYSSVEFEYLFWEMAYKEQLSF